MFEKTSASTVNAIQYLMAIVGFSFFPFRRCDTGEGIFVFKTTDGERIHQMVQNNAHLLAGDPHNVSSTDDEEFGFRALPPLPQE